MRIRCHRRTLNRKNNAERIYLSVVESRRINGQPRTVVICYLGTVRPEHPNLVAQAATLWRKVSERLKHRSLTDDQILTIERSIAEIVPRPTDGQMAELEARRLPVMGKGLQFH